MGPESGPSRSGQGTHTPVDPAGRPRDQGPVRPEVADTRRRRDRPGATGREGDRRPRRGRRSVTVGVETVRALPPADSPTGPPRPRPVGRHGPPVLRRPPAPLPVGDGVPTEPRHGQSRDSPQVAPVWVPARLSLPPSSVEGTSGVRPGGEGSEGGVLWGRKTEKTPVPVPRVGSSHSLTQGGESGGTPVPSRTFSCTNRGGPAPSNLVGGPSPRDPQ